MSQGFTIGSDESFRRLDQVVRWGIKKIQGSEGGDDRYLDIPVMMVEITVDTADENGLYAAKFVVRDLSVVPYVWRDLGTDQVCKVDPADILPTLVNGKRYSVYMTEYKDGYPICIPISGATGDEVEVGEPFNTGETPPLPKLRDWRLLFYNLATDDFDGGPSVWVRNANE